MSHIPVPEIHKRDRDDATEALIREALEEEQQRKKAKKGEVTGKHRSLMSYVSVCKGKTDVPRTRVGRQGETRASSG